MRRWAAFLAPGLLALLAHACGGEAGTAEVAPAPAPDARVVITARVVCRLIAGNEGARAVQITGSDGAQSVVANGRQYWFFGDTVRTTASGRDDVVPSAVATTDDAFASDCIGLRFKAENNTVAPMFARGDETTAWPDGVLALDDGSILFYMVKAYRTSPFAWYVGSIGLGRIEPGSMTGTRVVESIWDEDSGFGSRVVGARSPVLYEGDVIVYLSTEAGRNYVARAPLADVAVPAAYTYWDGAGWTPDPASAAEMWSAPDTGFPADNGVDVSFDAQSNKWIALTNGEMARIEVRSADRPWGPWSAPVQWLDCRPLVEDRYPYCYTGELHAQLARDDGDIAYVTFSSQRPYDVTLVELRFGAAVHEWQRGGEYAYSPVPPDGGGWTDNGVTFYGVDQAGDGLVPLHEGSDVFVPERPSPGLRMAPVYAWSRDGVTRWSTRELDGWERGAAAFYAPCAGFEEKPQSCE